MRFSRWQRLRSDLRTVRVVFPRLPTRRAAGAADLPLLAVGHWPFRELQLPGGIVTGSTTASSNVIVTTAGATGTSHSPERSR
jgi:hypothetical protein